MTKPPSFPSVLVHFLLVALVVSTIHFQPAIAAVVIKGKTSGMGCNATLEGSIETGDVARAEEALQAPPPKNDRYSGVRARGRLCLDSGGGSFEEGLRLAVWLASKGIATAVGRGARCESACAIAFMGGTTFTESDAGNFPNRVVHPLGKLGFHAPSLDVPKGRYNQNSVTKAYDTALQSIEGILRVSDGLNIRRSLTIELMSTLPTEMRYIETVGEASRWGIAVAPVIERKDISNADVWRACNNIDAYLLDRAPNIFNFFNDLPSPQLRDGIWQIELAEGFRQELVTGCSMSYSAYGSDQRYYDWGGWLRINDVAPLWGFHFYLPETPIAQIALQNDRVTEFGPQPEVTRDIDFTGNCYVLKNAEIVDSDPCTMKRTLSYFADYSADAIDTYTWPSGARTVLTHSSGEDSFINGIRIPILLKDPDAARTKDVLLALRQDENPNGVPLGCYKNLQSGNHFCFLDDQKGSNSEFSRSVYR